MKRALLFTAVVLAVDVAGARWLDAAEVAEGLLAGRVSALWVPLIVGVLAARLALYLVVPGIWLRALVLRALDWPRGRAGRPR